MNNRIDFICLCNSQDFINRFNENVISEEFLEKCKKAGELFNRKDLELDISEKIQKTIKLLSDNGIDIISMKINTKTSNKIPFVKSSDEIKENGYKKIFKGIPVVLDESIQDDVFHIEIN